MLKRPIFQRFPHFARAVRVLAITLAALVSHSKAHASDLDLNPLRFTNRSRCALDSETPTQSYFLLIDGFNAGRVSRLLAPSIGMPPAQAPQEGMKLFRETITTLAHSIQEKLLAGTLPLLPSNLNQSGVPADWGLAIQNCETWKKCKTLDEKLSRLWVGAASPFPKFQAQGAERVRCQWVKKFSALQGHQLSTRADAMMLEQIALADLHREETLDDCFEPTPGANSQNTVLQFDLRGLDEASWNRQGFDFWNSLRIYLSWAWRNAPETRARLGRFSEPFRSIAIEESLLLIPNGCRSLAIPRCDSATLTMNGLRDFFPTENALPDSARQIPAGPEAMLTENLKPEVQNDVLKTREHATSAEWLSRFRSRLLHQRGRIRNRFVSATHLLQSIASSIPAQSLLQETLRGSQDPRNKLQNYYLCHEFSLAGHPQFSLLHDDLKLLAESKALDQALQGTNPHPVREIHRYFEKLSQGLVAHCQELEKSQPWDLTQAPDPAGFHGWFLEMTDANRSTIADRADPPRPPAFGAPLLVDALGKTVCVDAIDCSRLFLRAMIDLQATLQYVEGYLPGGRKIETPALLNPYAERVACRTYDPWHKTNAALVSFLSDAANIAAFSWNTLPVFFGLQLEAGQVTSIEKLMADGKLRFNPKLKDPSLSGTLMADLGPLTGVPCFVSVSNSSNDPLNPYVFAGIQASTCRKETNVTQSLQSTDTSHRSACVGCYLNFISLTEYLKRSNTTPLARPVTSLFFTLHHFFQSIGDTSDIPSTQTIDIDLVTDTYRRFGKIPLHCVRRLTQGQPCLENRCEEYALKRFESEFGRAVRDIQITQTIDDRHLGGSTLARGRLSRKIRAKVLAEGCASPVEFRLEVFGSCESTSTQSVVYGPKSRELGAKCHALR